MGTAAFGTARDGPHVAHVRDAVQHHNEGRFTALVAVADHVVKFRKADGAEEGNDPLVVLLGEALQLFNRHKFHMDATLFGGLQNRIDRFLASARHKNAVYFLARFEGL